MGYLPSLCLLLVLLGAVDFGSCQVNSRIVGGEDAAPGDWPWQVSIWYNNDHACGGSVIANKWVLSAAHCFPLDHSWSDYDVKAGAFQLGVPEQSVQSSKIDNVKIQPQYSQDSSSSADLALVSLVTALTFNKYIQPVYLPSANTQFPVGMKCKVTGWGNIRQGESLSGSKTLQVGQVTLIGRNTCNCLYHIKPSATTLGSIEQGMICAGSAAGSVDACQGDSGGPLSCPANNKWYQVGVVSWGDECGAPNRPGVYIMTSTYANWIKGIVPEAQMEDVAVDYPSQPENDSGCTGADGVFYPNGAPIYLVTFATLPLYWLTTYLLTNC
ncbi:prostasin isoform X1 [Pelobates cultripes]|uniref:Prostasin isoform X1 n=1 Tax=Pelobates cultripes TaxID=61616 RepID=A0AAD1SQV6_PELCU|nr:prostasin isoform X1 [Pelobates cultripes]CAH2307941.1 prostasin isoform X1 [Pelobates cultripes]CAH2307942.1 prostasin isoform X1 [Pelobates cultripes]CAH2307943.1 prostasin isoform X1 [Pelobates cultripes]CAH2307946.1 prostasin isoform X1 [Pelobates cultripes]